MKLGVLLSILGVAVVLRLLRAGLLVWLMALMVGVYVVLRHGFVTPLPDSAMRMYLAITALALSAYATSSRDRTRQVVDPVLAFVTERRFTLPLAVVAVLIPGLVAWSVYRGLQQPIQPPFFARTVHPAPPSEIAVHGQKIDLLRGQNPLRALEQSDAEAFAAHVANGRRIYYQNCVFCHGDSLGGDGMFAYGVSPVPANFLDSGVLPNFQETFFFWRIAKGGPGMPEEGAPGDSVMPEWERFLDSEQIWEVLLFLYHDTGYRPRALDQEALGAAH
ncbi:MAG TPA: cytochrome c [Candidatus Dormibacteraeota bacterium]|nr:cytochrome c [Candidatus Dormibacteraeota bacterium]